MKFFGKYEDLNDSLVVELFDWCFVFFDKDGVIVGFFSAAFVTVHCLCFFVVVVVVDLVMLNTILEYLGDGACLVFSEEVLFDEEVISDESLFVLVDLIVTLSVSGATPVG